MVQLEGSLNTALSIENPSLFNWTDSTGYLHNVNVPGLLPERIDQLHESYLSQKAMSEAAQVCLSIRVDAKLFLI